MSTCTKPLTNNQHNTTTYSIYFAGGLFDIRQLHGNASLADHIQQLSCGKYRVCLPQDIEIREFDPHTIRDDDFKSVISSDLCIVQFDGTELDSGTVAEFMMAKMADIPTLIIRTDFRGSGDQGQKGDPWNLMLSHFPRTEVLCVDALALYKEKLALENNSVAASEKAFESIAKQMIQKLELLSKIAPTMPEEVQMPVYSWLAKMAGYKKPASDLMRRALESKKKIGLL